MLKNSLIIAFRRLWQQKSFSILNVMGLTVGILACLLILQYVLYENSYDDFHEHKDRIYRVAMKKTEANGKEQPFAFTFPAVAPTLEKNYPEIQEAVRIRKANTMLRAGNQIMADNRIRFVDEGFFELFSYQWQEGDRREALREPENIVLSQRFAHTLFGSAPALGKTVELQWFTGEWLPFQVSGVIENAPENTHLTYDVFLPYRKYVQLVAQFGADAENSWTWSDFYTYILMKPGTEITALEQKLPALVQGHLGEGMKRHGYHIDLLLQPIDAIHLHSDLDYEFKVNGDYTYVRLSGLIALFILLIAWINYINLSTARSLDRSKEIGVRKVIGARRSQLMLQFLSETFVLNALAVMIAVLMFKFSLPWFGQLTGRALEPTLLATSWLLPGLLTLLSLGALFAGLYPAFVLSGFQPINALRDRLSFDASGTTLRKGLVVFQFAASIALIAGALVVYRQIGFMKSQDLGIDIDRMLIIEDEGSRDSTQEVSTLAFVQSLQQHPSVQAVSRSGDIPGKEVGQSSNVRWANSGSQDLKRVRGFAIDHRFMDNYGMEIIAGRGFRENYLADTSAYILNETAMELLGFESSEQAIGERLLASGQVLGQVVGIVRDYHQEGLHTAFKPIAFYRSPQGLGYFSVRLQAADLTQTLAFAEQSWQRHMPDAPFTYFFLNEFFDRQYRADIQFGYIVGLFTFLAIFIACLGLFGLSAFSVARRAKEISIRKVLGATLSQILVTLSREYFYLLLIASAVALPAAGWLASRWLDSYAFSISLSWWFFLLPVLLIMGIAWLTIGYQSVKAALSNPASVLKDE